jgi:asparagine synthase (glutamine-hydrolysing)
MNCSTQRPDRSDARSPDRPLGYEPMCGICGLFSRRGGVEGAERPIGAMVAALAHRGPDASGVHVDDRAAIGSTRLAIIDLVGGDQPIYSEDRSVCLV